jgi:hypothetical protein
VTVVWLGHELSAGNRAGKLAVIGALISALYSDMTHSEGNFPVLGRILPIPRITERAGEFRGMDGSQGRVSCVMWPDRNL